MGAGFSKNSSKPCYIYFSFSDSSKYVLEYDTIGILSTLCFYNSLRLAATS